MSPPESSKAKVVPVAAEGARLVSVPPAEAVATPADGAGLVRGIVDFIRRKNRARLARRRLKREAARAERLLAATEPADAPARAPTGAFEHATWVFTPASHEACWSAYERLKAKLQALRRASVSEYVPRPCKLIEAPRDLATFARGLELPHVEAPLVSVIMPAFNHVRETLEGIASVAAHTASRDYELILVDDASGDESAALLPLVRNLRYLRNERNGGFILSCNRGAREARGRYLVFLNNDAQVTHGWLEPLIETFSAYERVGAVGPKVLYPNGRLQEAGAMVNPDMSVTMVGVGDDPTLARYNYPREVHYCSGVCLAVERAVFEALGGFDPELAPAYYEDCDLQLRLRQRGLRTMYQPRSVVVHHLSVTSEGLPDPEAFKRRQIVRNSQRMRERWGATVDAMDAVRLIAFYLPQFHPLPENDFWWGKGFTEWTNVTKARPNFVGHVQPRLPTELGFYDLRLPGILEEQARLAREYGIFGFCFYYYWFNGKRLLDKPVERLLREPDPGIPFCLCWANENWTRRWDGGDGGNDVIMSQRHSDEDDEAVIDDLMRYFRRPSYITVHGKPVLLVYRVELFPNVRRTTEIWRAACRRAGIAEPYLVRVDSFDNAKDIEPPAKHGCDAAVEFPPHHCGAPLKRALRKLNESFKGIVHDYEEVVLRSARYKEAGYTHFRGVMPGWDNTPRRQDESVVFANSTPGAYQAWLEEVLRYTREQNVGDERIVFLNAWNEWAEGAYLEPDRKYGRAYLEATRNALGASMFHEET